MKLNSTNVNIIVNDEMNLALVQIRDKNIFMTYKEFLKLGDILNEYDDRDELRDLINDYKKIIK